MFDFSLAEFGVVGIVALIFLGPKDLLEIIKSLQKINTTVKDYFNQYVSYLNKSVLEEENIVDVIQDLDGNMQKVYNLKKIMPEIIESPTDLNK
jgi:sec-independent protein translocase protein TatB